jgi:hypothetical protein
MVLRSPTPLANSDNNWGRSKNDKYKFYSGPWSGAVTLIQHFGSALNLYLHFHMLYLDGVYDNKGYFWPVRLFQLLSKLIIVILNQRSILATTSVTRATLGTKLTMRLDMFSNSPSELKKSVMNLGFYKSQIQSLLA